MKKIFFVILLVNLITSCEKYDECIIPVIGVYDAHIVGHYGPFSMAISEDYGDNISIDAPWLYEEWHVIEADIDGCSDYENYESNKMDIYISKQKLGDGIYIKGRGFYSEGSIQIDYTVYDYGEKHHFTLIGTKH